MIDVTLLGTAALLPIPDRALTAASLVCAGRVILFDCGEGTQTAARRAGVSLMRADLIALTHYHGDHIFGLPGLLQTLGCLNRAEPLVIAGPLGLRDAMEPILKLAGHLPYEVRLAGIPEGGMALSDLNGNWPSRARLTAFDTRHRVPSQGYCFTLDRAGRFLPEKARSLGLPVGLWSRLQSGESVRFGESVIEPSRVMGPPRRGLKVVFSGDTAPCDALAEAARGADLLICDATYGEDDQAGLAHERGHMTFAEAAGIASRAGARRLWLSHYSQMIEDPQACLPNATAVFSGAVCGEDGMALTLHFED